MTSTFLGKLKQKTYMLLGYKNVQSINLGKAIEITSPDRDEAEKKRKHDEILTDEGSETDEDMANFDYENYDSEEDPDYEPDSAEESEDSESEDDDAESDIELEVVKNETNPAVEFVQLKEKQKDAALIPKEEPHKSAPEVGKPANKDEISLKPQWQQDTKLVTQKRKSLDDETKSS
ncbi:uncharacterized protein LOC123523039 [Mercenaria mercenaria]|uniref:uncharacterized protein LOC123523039 n=1 Tax=Mercenaria mercenaria TaxID=6596 RepID=UPI00234F8C86|nr:uncharacterized protein LOC123523039 [Mercenaria mercenaria]